MDCGFATALGQFTSKWVADGKVFQLHISTPAGTTGTVGIPFPGKSTKAFMTSDLWNGPIRADSSGRFWVGDVAGGEHNFVIVA